MGQIRHDPHVAIARRVWDLAWPATLHLSVLTSVFVADRALVGQLGADALAALHGASTLAWTVASVLGAVGVGALAVVGAHTGAGRVAAARQATVGAMMLTGMLSAGAALMLWLGRDFALEAGFPALGEGARHLASDYLAVLVPALPLGLVATTAAACLHARGDTKTPLRAAVVGNVLNLGVSTALVFGVGGAPALGVVGAAVGSALGFAAQAGWLLASLRGHGAVRWVREELQAVLATTRPVLAERVVYHASYLAFAAVIGTLGLHAMAAHQGLLGVEAFFFTVAEGFGVAAAALVAQHHGAGAPGRALQTAVVAMAMAAAVLGVVAALALAVGTRLGGWLITDDLVRSQVTETLPIAAATLPICGVAVVGSAALRGMGATRHALVITLVSAVGVRLGATMTLTPMLGLRGAWCGAALDWSCQAAAVMAVLSVRFSRPSVGQPRVRRA